MHQNLYKIILIFLLYFTNISYTQNDESWKIYDDSEIAVIKIYMDENDLAFMFENPNSDSMHIAAVSFKNSQIDEVIDSVGVRIRGNTSRESNKKSIKLSFNTFVNGGKFYGVEKLNVNGEHNDPSIVRSKLCWDFFNEIDVISSRAAHTELYINDEYYGLYISIEHIDKEFLRKNYKDNSGNLWKCLFGADLDYIGNNPDLYKFVNSSGNRPYELKRNTEEDDYSQLAKLIYEINSTSNPNYEDSVEAIINVNGLLKYFATNILVGSWDDYWSLSNNYYLYFDPKVNKFDLIPYDYDNTFGITWWNIDWAAVNPYSFAKVYSGKRPLVENILKRPKYHNLYTHFLEYYSELYFGSQNFVDKLTGFKTILSNSAQADTFRIPDWGYTFQDFLNSYDQQNYFFENNVIVPGSILDFVNKRRTALISQIEYKDHAPIIYDIDLTSTKLPADEELSIYASIFSHLGIKTVEARIVINNGDPLNYAMNYTPIQNSLKIEEADLWTVTLPSFGYSKNIIIQIVAEDNNGNISTFPENGIKIITPSEAVENKVLISEVMSLNGNAFADEFDEYDDWLEIFNPQNNSIDLSGKYLTDKIDNLNKWQIPEGTVIPANEFILFWCDEDQEQGRLHTNFRLKADGEFLAIVDSDGLSIIDSLTLPPMNEDESLARINNTGDWIITVTPTPGTSNIVTHIAGKNLIDKTYEIYAYPNPFNPYTKIRYSIPNNNFGQNIFRTVKIVVYDILGKEVTTLINEKHKPGNYEIDWNAINSEGSEISSGIYFLNITTDNFSKSLKLVLLS